MQETLQRMLCDHPHVGVGEVRMGDAHMVMHAWYISHPCTHLIQSGLDKVHARRQANTTLAHEQQLDALHAHMTLAAHYQRPLSLHCVQSYGPLVDMLTHAPTNTTILRSNDMSPHANTAASPPAVVLHSYTGSADTTTRLLHATAHSQHMRVLFSLSGGTLRRLAPEKQRALLGAIPLDHVLLETDADGKGEVVGLQETCRMVAPWIGGGVVEGELMRASVKNATSVFG